MTDEVLTYCERLLPEHGLDVATCWTVIEPIGAPATLPKIAPRLGGDPATLRPRPWTAAYDAPEGSQVVYLVQAGPAVALIEINGYRGNQHIERLSDHARAHCAYWNVNAHSELSCAAFGQLLVAFEGLGPDQRRGIDICALDDHLDPLHAAVTSLYQDDGPSHWAAMMTVIERRTGVRLAEQWMTSDLPSVLVPDPPDTPTEGFVFDPELEAALWLAPDTRNQDFTRALAHLLVDTGQLTDEPEVQQAMAHLAADVPIGDSRYEPLRDLAERLDDHLDNPTPTSPMPGTPPSPMPGTPRWRSTLSAWALFYTLMPPEHTPRRCTACKQPGWSSATSG